MKDGGPRFPKRRWMFEGQKIMYFQYITLHNDLFRCQQGTLPPYNSHGGRILLCISTSVRIPPLAYVFKRFSKIKFVKKNIRRSIFKAKIVGTWNVQSYSNDLFFFYSRTRVDLDPRARASCKAVAGDVLSISHLSECLLVFRK